MSCWNYISDYHTVLNQYYLTCWSLTPLYYMHVLFLNGHFPPCRRWNWISVPFERQKNHWNLRILYFMRHFTDTINDIMKVGTRDRDDHLKLEHRPWEKDHFWTKSYYVTSVGNNVTNPLIFFKMSMLHHMSTWYLQTYLEEKIGLKQKKTRFISIDTGTQFAMVLCFNFMGILFFSFSKYVMSF